MYGPAQQWRHKPFNDSRIGFVPCFGKPLLKGTTEVNIGLRSVCWTIPFYRTCGFPGHLLCWDDLFSLGRLGWSLSPVPDEPVSKSVTFFLPMSVPSPLRSIVYNFRILLPLLPFSSLTKGMNILIVLKQRKKGIASLNPVGLRFPPSLV